MRILVASLGLLLAACSHGSGSAPPPPSGPDLIAGFTPPAAGPGDTTYVSPVLGPFAPGQDVTLCSYLDTYLAAETDVNGFRVYQSPFGHHAILFAAAQPRPVDTHPCTDEDMLNTRFIAAGGSDSNAAATLFEHVPDGLVFRFPAGAQIMFQTHWINASAETLPAAQAIAYLQEGPVQPGRQLLDLFNVVSDSFNIPPQQMGTATTTCTLPQDVQLFSLDGHQHEWGRHVDIELLDGSTSTMLWSHDWTPEYQFNPPINVYSVSQPLLLKAGQSVRVNCTWDNTTPTPLSFPREMCVGSGFYFPAMGEIDCVEGSWSQNSPM
jgi:hypothetical protein